MFNWIQTLFKTAKPDLSSPPEASQRPSEAASSMQIDQSKIDFQAPIEPVQEWSNGGLEEAIRLEAYYLWEADGRPEGNGDYYWQKASERVGQRRGGVV